MPKSNISNTVSDMNYINYFTNRKISKLYKLLVLPRKCITLDSYTTTPELGFMAFHALTILVVQSKLLTVHQTSSQKKEKQLIQKDQQSF